MSSLCNVLFVPHKNTFCNFWMLKSIYSKCHYTICFFQSWRLSSSHFLPQPPEVLRLQACTSEPNWGSFFQNFLLFSLLKSVCLYLTICPTFSFLGHYYFSDFWEFLLYVRNISPLSMKIFARLQLEFLLFMPTQEVSHHSSTSPALDVYFVNFAMDTFYCYIIEFIASFKMTKWIFKMLNIWPVCPLGPFFVAGWPFVLCSLLSAPFLPLLLYGRN